MRFGGDLRAAKGSFRVFHSLPLPPVIPLLGHGHTQYRVEYLKTRKKRRRVCGISQDIQVVLSYSRTVAMSAALLTRVQGDLAAIRIFRTGSKTRRSR
jgi:hypothetical protein